MALSRDGKGLYAVNTPDNRLEVFDVKKNGNGLVHKGSILVGVSI